MSEVRVRFAPSPTGPLHIGGVRTALYNYLFAKNKGGKFILRIEDTDQARFVEGAEQYIFESLKWCGIEFDESVIAGGEFGPYKQSERKAMYLPYAEQLVKDGFAYYAFDSSEELTAMRERMKVAGVPSPQYNAVTRTTMQNSLALSEDEVTKRRQAGEAYVIRIKMPRNEEVKLNDIIRGWVVVNTNNMDDKVIFKSDGTPTYHLANVIDDYLMKISHVIRGEEWLPSAPLHVLLYRYLGWEDVMPQFAHLPLILKPDGNGKLSKRDGDRLGFPVFPTEWMNPETKEISSGYRESGYIKEAFINMLSFLGWNPGTTQEIFSMEGLIESFSLDRVGKAGAKFDFDKTRWFNQQYLRAKLKEELAQDLQLILKENGVEAEDNFVETVCEQLKERATFVKDMWEEGKYYFLSPTSYDEKTIRKKWKEDTPKYVSELKNRLAELADFSSESIEIEFKKYLEENELGMGKLLPAFRVCLTGLGMGPSIFDIASLLGKEKTIKRMETALEKIN
ncbi:MAG: glutamate--tRNA ligase [Flavobacteriales bacterium]|jgi:glutamyl-tRNA synthetase|nr:glutamate--tRNA ligase [Flavobacteriales bacterium]MDP7430465.1 glutamate--tRNA ligase [Flavobacteriales bacterium]HJN63286.1 glutamate--tRNA ligase [Flavobacteriales bacterium]|tara:strand:- start:4337 stop:5860 length:1524 start_codon:yes stop_codon:yes gene_type:complete